MAGLLIAIDKSPGVSPIAIGEVLRRLIAKCVIGVANGEAQEALWVQQLGCSSTILGSFRSSDQAAGVTQTAHCCLQNTLECKEG